MHSIPAPSVADVVVVVNWMLNDVGVSVAVSEPFEDIVKLFVTANVRVEPTMTVFGVVLGQKDSAENSRHKMY